MKNWMIELEKHVGTEEAKIIIQVLAGSLIVSAIIAGNWHLFN